MKWQPIETAPKDKYILLCLGGRDWATGCWNRNIWDGDDKNWGVWVSDEETDEPFYFKPTHWMELPELPPVSYEDHLEETNKETHLVSRSMAMDAGMFEIEGMEL